MSNSFFCFKQFTVHQDKCAMKVCTDACAFGAWIANKISNDSKTSGLQIRNILDIGAGTGLLSLMIAQKNPHAIIDAVEINGAAAQQAKENFNASPWKERLTVYHTPIQQFNLPTKQPYDFIISNPPFFEKNLKSQNDNKNIALHSQALTLKELFIISKEHLSSTGKIAILLPYDRTDSIQQLAEKESFFLEEKILLKQTPHHNYFRSILVFKTISIQPIHQSELIIHDEHQQYTHSCKTLLKDYYLYL